MDNIEEFTSPKQIVDNLAHLSWCALIALYSERQKGLVQSKGTANLFLIRWFSTALKQHRFPRVVAQDIESFIQLGRNHGSKVCLQECIERLYKSCTDPIMEQSDLFRLSFAIEQMKEYGWINREEDSIDWINRSFRENDGAGNTVIMNKLDLQNCFSKEGTLLSPVSCVVIGNEKILQKILSDYGFDAVLKEKQNNHNMMILSTDRCRMK